MGLSSNLLTQFAKVVKEDTSKKETAVYGEIVKRADGSTYVKLDGSDLITPVTTTTDVTDGERVTVSIKNHIATVTGNISSPSINLETQIDNGDGTYTKVGKFGEVIADKVSTQELEAEKAIITELIAKKADIDHLHADYAKVEDLKATNANIEKLDAKYVNIDFTNIDKAWMDEFYARSGIIQNVTISEGVVVKELVGVTIKGDLIEGNTIKADKLVVKGTDGLYYKLNVTEGGIAPSEQVSEEDLQNGLHGSNIIAKTITAEKIQVNDLVAFGATIGRFHIDDDEDAEIGSIYSGVKASVDNTTDGIYMDSDGQFAVGGLNNYLKFFKDTDGNYKLDVSANSIKLGSGKDIDAAIDDAVNDAVDGFEIGGRNYIRNGNFSDGTKYWSNWGSPTTREIIDDNGKQWVHIVGSGTDRWQGYSQGKLVSIDSEAYYTITALVYGGAEEQLFTMGQHWLSSSGAIISQSWKKDVVVGTTPQKVTFQAYAPAGTEYINFMIGVDSATTVYDVYFTDIKFEKGNKATDYTPAPEDMEADITTVQTGVDNNAQSISEAKSNIELLSTQISTLVQDGSGRSLMTQTSSGWVFSMGDIEEALNNLLAHIKIGTYNGQPCLELVVDDTKQKLMLTNTEIRFMESDTTAAYISGNIMNIDHAQIDNKLTIGSGYGWAEDSDEILNLIYQ